MCLESGLIGPRFANHEHVGARGALEGVVGNAACVLTRSGGQGQGGLEGFFVLTLVGLEETVQSQHGRFVFSVRNNR